MHGNWLLCKRHGWQALVLVLVVVSCSTVILQTLPELHELNLLWLEVVVTAVFSLELALRLAEASSLADFFTDGLNVVDVIAVLPGYIEAAARLTSPDLSAPQAVPLLRIAWFIRILRVLKVARYFPSLSLCIGIFLHALSSSALAILAVLSFLMVVSASLLYLVESDRCEELGVPCDGFESIPDSFWFSICTLTTVGYGDVYPVTTVGKAIAAFLAVCAVIIMALAAALLSVHFTEMHLHEHLDFSERSMVEELSKVSVLHWAQR